MLEHWRATACNQRICFSAKFSPTFGSFSLESLDLIDGPASAQALARAYEAGAMSVIASIILLALIVAAVSGGCLILARRFMSLLDISAASSLLVADGSVAALTESAIR